MLLLAVLLACACADAAEDGRSNTTIQMVEKIRRQLMEDNYDYLPSESELVTPPHAPLDRSDGLAGHARGAQRGLTQEARNDISNDNDRQHDKLAATYDDGLNEIGNNDGEKDELDDRADDRRNRVRPDDEIRDYDADDDKLDYFVPRAKADENEGGKGQEPPRGHVVSKKDLLYYVDDERLRGHTGHLSPAAPADLPLEPADLSADRSADPAGSASMSVEDFSHDKAVVDEAAGATARYKVIKVNRRASNRRSQPARFIQEESARGVALISLDGQPFPQFHLPRARRQYMHDRSAEPGEAPALNPSPADPSAADPPSGDTSSKLPSTANTKKQ